MGDASDRSVKGVVYTDVLKALDTATQSPDYVLSRALRACADYARSHGLRFSADAADLLLLASDRTS